MAGISFKIAKTGTRYSPSARKKSTSINGSPPAPSDNEDRPSEAPPQSPGSKRKRTEFALSKINADHFTLPLLSTTSYGSTITSEHEASFAVNLFLDGFCIGKPTEQGKQPRSAQEFTKSLHPYNRISETFFQAIDDGVLPGDILEEIPCKYVDGCVLCEVRDYRKGLSISDDALSLEEGFPVIEKVLLRPTMENIVKDVSSMAEESRAYGDLMEIESRILKAVQPKLCLDPTPMLERLCENPNSNKIKLGVPMRRRERMQRGSFPLVKVIPNNLSYGKKVAIEGTIPKAKSHAGICGTNSAFEDFGIACSQEVSASTSAGISSSIPANQSKVRCNIQSGQDLSRVGMLGSSNSVPMQSGLYRSRLLHGQGNRSPLPSPGTSVTSASAFMQEWSNSRTDARHMTGLMPGKIDSRDLPMVSKPDLKKPKQEQTFMDKFQQLNGGPKVDPKQVRDQQRQDMSMQQNQNNENVYFYPQRVMADDDRQMSVDESKFSSHLDQRSTMPFKVKEEHTDFERESQEIGRYKENQHLMELDGDPSGPPKMLSQRLSQQQYKSTFQWQSLQLGEKDQKRDDLLQKKKLVHSPKEMQKQDVRSILPSPPLPVSGESSQPLTSTAAPSTSLGPSYNNIAASAGFMQQKEKPLGLSAVSTSVASVNSSQNNSQHQQAQQSVSFGKHRSNSLPRTTSASGVASPGSVTNAMAPSNVNSPSTGTAPMPGLVTKQDQSVVTQGQNKHLATISLLVGVAQRHGLHRSKKSVGEVPTEQKKAPPSWHLISVALESAENNGDQKDGKGQRSLANSLVGGGVNIRKMRILNFVRADHTFQANSLPVLIRRNQVRLVMCERAKDGKVDVVVQFGDDQDEDSMDSCPHVVLPSLPNTHFADRLAGQFCTLMVKDGYELIEDKIQPIQQRQQNLAANASSTTHSIALGVSAHGNNMNQLSSSPLVMASQNMPGSDAVCGIPPLNSLPLPSSNSLAAVPMPSSGNAPNRQLSAGFLQSGLGTSSKPLQLNPASQLAVLQQQPHQQLPHQLQQHSQQQLQRSQQLVSTNHLAQLNAASHNSNQQMNSQIMNSASHLQIQMLQHHHRQQQQQQQLQRKMILPGSLGNSVSPMGLGTINGVNSMSGVGMSVSRGPQGGLNMVGLNGMSTVVGMAGINNISASMGSISNLPNISPLSGVGGIGQSTCIGNMMGQHIRAGVTNHAAAAFATKIQMAQARGRPGAIGSPSIRNTMENITGISTSNQVHSSMGLAMLGQQGRGNMGAIQSRGMGPPKIGTTGMPGVAGQNFYMNQQVNNQSQQINSQQQLSQQKQLDVLQQINVPQPSLSQQPLSSQPLLNVQHQLNQQQQISAQQLNSQSQINPQQQHNLQQLNSQSQLNPQPMNAGNLGSLVGGPSSPQLSSQTLGSAGSITSSPMELQSANRGNSMTTGQ